MPKTYADQVRKARTLVAGLKENYELVRDKGIGLGELTELEAAAAEGLNNEVERLRSEVGVAVKKANRKLLGIKERVREYKRIVKRSYDAARLPEFGVLDKR